MGVVRHFKMCLNIHFISTDVLCGGIRFFLARGGCTQARFSSKSKHERLFVVFFINRKIR